MKNKVSFPGLGPPPEEEKVPEDRDPEDLAGGEARPAPGAGALKSRKGLAGHQMSMASRKFDGGGKGYLDEDERMLRNYDQANRGSLTLGEMKRMAADYRGAVSTKEMYGRMLLLGGMLLLLSWAGNFGLIWATVALTRKVDTQGGDLTDTSGKRVATTAKGDHVRVTLSPDTDFRFLRRLTAGTLVGTLAADANAMQAIWADYLANTVVGFSVETTVNGATTTHTGTIESGAAYAPDADGCAEYSRIRVQGRDGEFKVRCCGADACYAEQVGSVNCFSSASTVVERTKGRMPLRDLEVGDSVLAAGGAYQPFVFDIHSNPAKPFSFVQIHTTASEDEDSAAAPLEASPDHFVFVHGKVDPVPAGEIEVGDSLVGVNGQRKVTKVTSVMRTGFWDPLTADATLFVDGVLASSMVDATSSADASVDEPNYVNFGLFKVHIHTFTSRVVAPLFRVVCTRMDPRHCDTKVDDNDGGRRNILMEAGRVIVGLPQPRQALFLVLVPAAAAVSLVSYCLFLAVAGGALAWPVVAAVKERLGKKRKSA